MAFHVPEVLRSTRSDSVVWRFGAALAAVTAATCVRAALEPVLGEHAPYLPFVLAVAVAARAAGRGSGFAATGLSALATVWLFNPSLRNFSAADPAAVPGLALFIVIGVLISVLVGDLRSALVATARAEQLTRHQTQLIDLSHDAIITFDANRRITGWNAGAEEMYGWTKAEVLGKVIHELLQTHVSAAAAVSTGEIDEVLSSRGRWEGELSHVARDGRRLCVESRQVQLRDAKNQPAAFLEINRDVTEKARAEEELRAGQHRLVLAQKAGRAGSFDWDARADRNLWSDELLALYGFKPGEFGGTSQDWVECLVPEDREAGLAAIQRSLETGLFELEFRIRRRDTGEIRWMYGRADVLFDDQGEPVRMVGINVDITERKQAEERLRESEFFYRQMLESIPGMVFTTRPDGYCDYQSQQWADYTGIPVSEHLGNGWNKLLHPDDRPRAFAAWRAAVEGRAPYDLEYRVRRYDGVYEWFKVIGRPIRDAAGQIVRWFGVALNIEALKRAEDNVRQALDQRKLAFEAADLGAWDYRFETGEISWDRQSQRIFGATGEDRLDYRDALARIHPDDRPAVDNAFKQAIAGVNGGAYHQEFRVVWPDGSLHWVAGHGRVFFESDGNQPRAVRYAGVNMEITGRKQAEERFRQAQKLESVGFLAGGVAHDFNNLLTVILGRATSALDDCPSCEHSSAIISAAERAAHLTKQLLAYAGKGQFVIEAVDLSDVVSRSRQLLEASIPKRVELVFNLANGLPCVEEDPSRIDQVLMNLVINAGEAIPPKTDGRIEVATGKSDVTPEMARRQSRYDVSPGTHVWLQVMDNGAGMDEATLSRIFDPFFSTKFAGRGLGLAAVDGIVRSNKGFIDVRSRPGGGTMFRVLIPASEKTRLAEIAPAVAPKVSGTSSTILVVDDEETVRKLASLVLTRHGYAVLEARDGRHALEVLAASPSAPALVLLDVAMPVMGGDELVPILTRRYPAINIIVSSGYPEEQARGGTLGPPVAGFLQKPYTAAALAEKVREILER